MANRVDSDQTPQNAASDLGLHCLLRPVSQLILRVSMVIYQIESPPLRNFEGPFCSESAPCPHTLIRPWLFVSSFAVRNDPLGE